MAGNSHTLAGLPAEFAPLVGEIDRAFYEIAPALFVGAWRDVQPATMQHAEDILESLLRRIQSFLMALWYVRDNCVMCDGGVLLYPGSNAGKVGWHGVKHSLAQYFWNASVQHGSTQWSRGELGSAVALAQDNSPIFGAFAEPISVHPALPKGISRVLRGYYYLENARMCSDIGLRVSGYVSCLEALFSTDSAELSHKLAERVAVFLARNGPERLSLFQEVKRAYTIRSKVVHGDALDEKQRSHLIDVSAKCDDVLRRVFVRIVKDHKTAEIFEMPKQELDAYFLARNLGLDEPLSPG